MNSPTPLGVKENGTTQSAPRAEQAMPKPFSRTTPRRNHSGLLIIAVIVLALLVAVVIWPRLRAASALAQENQDASTPTVTVVNPVRGKPTTELVLPSSIQAYQNTPIYARTNGYLRNYHVEIGQKVKAGDPLAEIDTPEIDQELRQARASLAQANANMELARTTLDRWRELIKSEAVSEQEVDEKKGAYDARVADVQNAAANVQRLEDLQSFKKIVAPFDGLITERNIDIGALVSTSNASTPLFRIAQTDPMRIYTNVPQNYVRLITEGLEVQILLQEFPDKPFTGKVVRTAGALDPATRTLLTEVQVPNPNNELLHGMYAQVKFIMTQKNPPMLVPVNVVMMKNKGPIILTVDSKDSVHYQSVKLGRDFGTDMEIIEGVDDQTRMIVNPSDNLHEGIHVKAKTLEKPALPKS